MSYLKATLIDVGWGDSILLEASDAGGDRPRFALIDSNDNAERDYWPSWNFLRKHFGVREDEFQVEKPFFDFVMLTHDHSDHGSGLKRIMKEYGTENFWYPRVNVEDSVVLTSLQSYAGHWRVNIDHEALDHQSPVGRLGDVSMRVLWPLHGMEPESDPNNNSIVLALTVHDTTVLLTGDAEGEVWDQIRDDIPENTRAVKLPHHGSRNGTLHHGGSPLVERLDEILDNLPAGHGERIRLGISCHPNYPNRFDFPHDDVIRRIEQRPYPYCRTDLHYHTTFTVDDRGLRVRYSHDE